VYDFFYFSLDDEVERYFKAVSQKLKAEFLGDAGFSA
jgi:hypothetical protein